MRPGGRRAPEEVDHLDAGVGRDGGQRRVAALAEHLAHHRVDRDHRVAAAQQHGGDAMRVAIRIRRAADHGPDARAGEDGAHVVDLRQQRRARVHGHPETLGDAL